MMGYFDPCDTFTGLTKEAELFLRSNGEPNGKQCGNCSNTTCINVKREKCGVHHDEEWLVEWPLYRWYLKDGTTVFEKVQAGSDSLYLMCLVSEDGEELFPWPAEEIESAI